MFILSSPSGAGKTSLSRRLLEEDPDIRISVSYTTRPQRPEEVPGRDYHFVTDDQFSRMLEQRAFLEHANVFDHRYGTPKAPVLNSLEQGFDILFDIDWQGTQQLAQHSLDDLVRVFILPPSMLELQRRLETRAQDNPDVIAGRMNRARSEISHWAEYDYVLINDGLERCVAQLTGILKAERLRRHRQPGLVSFTSQLIQ